MKLFLLSVVDFQCQENILPCKFDEDVETMLESFKQQQEMQVLELYIEKDVTGGSMFHFANLVTSCGNYLSNDDTQPPTNMSNLHLDEDDDDDDDYLVSNSYVEESLDEEDNVDGISDTDNEVTEIIPPVRIVHPNPNPLTPKP